jgi:hypothetical protein
VAEPPKFSDQLSVIGIQQGIGQQKMTVLFVISFGLGMPPPKGNHVASVVVTPEGAKALHGLLSQNLRNCGMLS